MSGKVKAPAYRYSIIPARAVTDPNITAQALRVLALLGRHTDENGWCRRSQVKMAEELGCSRGTIQNALDLLIGPENGQSYVERREETRPGVEPEQGRHPHCSYSYRVRLDLEDTPGANRLARVVPTARHPVPALDQHPVPTSLAPLTEPSPLEGPLANSHTPASAGESVVADCGKAEETDFFPAFRAALIETWPFQEGRFPAGDVSSAISEFDKACRRASPETLIECAKAHGVALWRAKAVRGVSAGPMLIKLPSNWLKSGGWMGYVDEAKALKIAEAARLASSEKVRETLGAVICAKLRRAGLRERDIDGLVDVTFNPGPPPRFLFPSEFARTQFNRFSQSLNEIWPGLIIGTDLLRKKA